MKGTLEKRFWLKVDKRGPDECWPWTASVNDYGYGKIGAGERGSPTLRAHRVSWEIHNGAVPDGLCVLHECDNPPCVNPKHLFLGTKADNTADMRAKGRARGNPACGEASPSAKLTTAQVEEIRRARGKNKDVAARFGISTTHACDIRNRKARMHDLTPRRNQ